MGNRVSPHCDCPEGFYSRPYTFYCENKELDCKNVPE